MGKLKYLFKITPNLIFLIITLFVFHGESLAQLKADSTQKGVDQQKLFYMENPKKDTTSKYELGIAFTFNAPSDDVKPGYGGALLGNFTGLDPFIITGSFQATWSKFKIPFLKNEDFTSIVAHLGIQYRINYFSKLKPYFGTGIGFFSNTYPSDEPCDGEIYDPGPYTDDYYCSHDYGSGLLYIFQAGSTLRISKKLSLFLDLKYLITGPKMEVTIFEYPSGTSYDSELEYDNSLISISFGVFFHGNSKNAKIKAQNKDPFNRGNTR